jgi:hypothetical protein
LDTEFDRFTKIVITPIKEEATKYVHGFIKSLKKQVAEHEKEVADFQSKNSNSMQSSMIAKGLYDDDLYKEYNLDKGKGETSLMENRPSKSKGKGSRFMKMPMKAMEKLSLKGKKEKGPENSALLSNAEQEGGISDLWEKFFDQLETEYIMNSKKDKV